MKLVKICINSHAQLMGGRYLAGKIKLQGGGLVIAQIIAGVLPPIIEVVCRNDGARVPPGKSLGT